MDDFVVLRYKVEPLNPWGAAGDYDFAGPEAGSRRFPMSTTSIAIVDGSSLAALANPMTENFWMARPSIYSGTYGVDGLILNFKEIFLKEKDQLSAGGAYLRYAMEKILPFFEGFLLFDDVICDERSFESVAHSSISCTTRALFDKYLSRMIRLEPLVERHGEQIASSVRKYIETIDDLRILSVFNGRKSYLTQEAEPVDEKIVFKDRVMSHVAAEVFGNSNNYAARALFYHELSRASGFPLILHGEKEVSLRLLKRELQEDLRAVLAKLSKRIVENLPIERSDIALPPMAYALLSLSLKEDISLMDAALRLKNDKEVSSLRKLLGELDASDARGRIHSAIKLKTLSETIANKIVKNSHFGISRLSSRTLALSEIPAISSVLKIFGIKEMVIPDVVLYETPYVTLFSKWSNFA